MTEPSNHWANYPAPLIPYVPTTEVVKDAYVRAMRNAFIASAGEHALEFNRWFAREKTVARLDGYAARIADEQHGIDAGGDWMRGVQADAWDRGYTAGAFDDFTNQPHHADNPYRRQENDDE